MGDSPELECRSNQRGVPARPRDHPESGSRMKQKLLAVLRILVSVGILAYLFNSIFEKEATERLNVIAESPTASASDLARELRISSVQVELVRTQGIEKNPETQKDEVNLK